jgi:hypothetical protein
VNAHWINILNSANDHHIIILIAQQFEPKSFRVESRGQRKGA